MTDRAVGGAESIESGAPGVLLKGRAVKLACLAWMLGVLFLQWVTYGPYGPLQRTGAFELILAARELLRQFFSARYVF